MVNPTAAQSVVHIYHRHRPSDPIVGCVFLTILDLAIVKVFVFYELSRFGRLFVRIHIGPRIGALVHTSHIVMHARWPWCLPL